MNAEIKKLWIEALRSGKYQQTTHALRTEDGYCCLGVLEDLLKERLGRDWRLMNTDEGEYSIGGSDEVLTSECMIVVGLANCDPSIKPIPYKDKHGECTCLSSANDNGYTFAEIADIIEAQL